MSVSIILNHDRILIFFKQTLVIISLLEMSPFGSF